MREILFRAKQLDDDEWVEGYYVNSRDDHLEEKNIDIIIESDNLHYDYKKFARVYYVDPNTLGQYTGVIDKNNNKIFDGDILSIKLDIEYSEDGVFYKHHTIHKKGIVRYSEDRLTWIVIFLFDEMVNVDWVDLDEYVRGSGVCVNGEVIGNVWDNGDLIKDMVV